MYVWVKFLIKKTGGVRSLPSGFVVEMFDVDLTLACCLPTVFRKLCCRKSNIIL